MLQKEQCMDHLVFLVNNRPRDEKGRFLDSSELDKNITGARLHKGYRERLIKIAKQKGINTTEFIRQILEDSVRQYEQDN